MFNIGAGEWLLLAVLGIILVGPDRLPHVASDAARLVRRFKELTSKATEELRENLGPGFEDLHVGDLNPKKFIAKTLHEAGESVLPTAELREISKSAKNAKIDPDLL
jgi:sec-independent protein translocase protein TatB